MDGAKRITDTEDFEKSGRQANQSRKSVLVRGRESFGYENPGGSRT